MRQTIPSGTRLPTIRGFSKSMLSKGEEQFLTHVSPTRTALEKLFSLYCGMEAFVVLETANMASLSSSAAMLMLLLLLMTGTRAVRW